ncbi:MAG: Na+/H+ antiporter NhaA [Bifidobacteriaceae bacterium]|jgi:NhaA family Na+:H+ antiporter|nr:Na+/H+ antiporter NhaA [Bifidobacteriaceae bacterium]
MKDTAPPRPRPHRRTVVEVLREENTGGILLAATAVIALLWANTPLSGSYQALHDWTFGPAAWQLHLSFGHWAADGLLTLFFFLVGLELKREFVVGELRNPRQAMLPIFAAVGGMVCPALIYLAFNLTQSNGAPNGWAVPVATDIAFSVAIMGLVCSHVPRSLRLFLLTLAVADDLLGIIVIALFYNTGGLRWGWLAGCLLATACFGVLVQRGLAKPWLLLPLALIAWYTMYRSGVHATISGVLLGFTVPAKPSARSPEPLGERMAFQISPLTYGLAVPVFALMTAGVSFSPQAISQALSDPATPGIALGLVVGKPLGILLATFLLVKFTRAELDRRLNWLDILAMGEVAGIGFTVSLLINELAFANDHERAGHGTMAVLTGSLCAAVFGLILMSWRNRVHKRRAESSDVDELEIPDEE